MVFVLRALSALMPGGVLGALLPASLLTLLAAEKWRASLIERTDVRMLAFLGDYGVFRHATVQVAGLVLRSGKADSETPALAMIAGDTAQSTGDAFRAVRRGVAPVDDRRGRWHVYPIPSNAFLGTTWRLVPPAARDRSRPRRPGRARVAPTSWSWRNRGWGTNCCSRPCGRIWTAGSRKANSVR